MGQRMRWGGWSAGVLIAALAGAGCDDGSTTSGDGGGAPGFVGTWTCKRAAGGKPDGRYSLTVTAGPGDQIIGAGGKGDAGPGEGCTFTATVSGFTATFDPGQTCTDEGETIVPDAGDYTLSSDGTVLAEYFNFPSMGGVQSFNGTCTKP